MKLFFFKIIVFTIYFSVFLWNKLSQYYIKNAIGTNKTSVIFKQNTLKLQTPLIGTSALLGTNINFIQTYSLRFHLGNQRQVTAEVEPSKILLFRLYCTVWLYPVVFKKSKSVFTRGINHIIFYVCEVLRNIAEVEKCNYSMETLLYDVLLLFTKTQVGRAYIMNI